MIKTLFIGFVTTVSGRWPRELPRARHKKYEQWLAQQYPAYKIVSFSKIVDDKTSLNEAIGYFKQQQVDILVLLYGAFSGDDYAVALAETVRQPLILWALPEPELHGGRLLANALVAATMNSASLKRLKHVSYFVYGSEDDARTKSDLDALFLSHQLKKTLSCTMFGLFGYRPTAFYNSTFDEALIRRTFGIRIEETDLKVIFDRMATYTEEMIKEELAAIKIPFSKNLPNEHVTNHTRLILALRQLIMENGYDYSVIKCWPEMGNLKTTPCAVIGRLADEGRHIICEGDVDAGIAYAVQNMITDQPCFITDLINIREDINALTLWHCGNPAPSLFSGDCALEIANHPLAGQGTAIHGVLKTGPVTVARFCNIDGKYKLFLLKGEAIPTEAYTPGAMVNIKIAANVRDVISGIIEEGIPHHYSVVWADVSQAMKAYAKIIGVEVVEF